MMQDPIRSRKADRWDALVASGTSPEAATAQVEREFAGQSTTSTMPASRGAAAAESTRVAPAGPRKPELSAGQIAKGVARSAIGQGAMFGFGEEAEAALTGRPVQEIRGEMKQFREAYPKTAFVGEVGGGLLTGGTGAMRAGAAAAGRGIVRRALSKATQLGIPQAALAGAGAAEGGLPERALGAGMGATFGGLVSAGVNPVAQKIAGRVIRGGAPDAGAIEVAQLARKAGMEPSELGPRAAQMGALAPEARVMDILGRPGVRRARAIGALGGRPGELMEGAMETRYGTRPERLQDILTQRTGRGPENIYESVDEIIQRRAQQAEPMYKAIREQPPVQSPELEAYLGRPAFRKAARDAETVLANRGVSLPMIDTPQGPMPARTPEFLDYVKRAIDDELLLETAPQKRNALAEARAEYVALLDDAIPGYREAREAFAGETALKNALESGAQTAAKTPNPRLVERTMAEMTDSERELFQRGYIDGLRQKIDDGKLRGGEIRTPKFAQTLDAMFGPEQGAAVREALSADVELMENAAKIVAGSRTAPLAADIVEETANVQPVAEGVRSFIEPRRAFARGVGAIENRLYGGIREGTRQQRAEELLRPASEIGPLLSRIAREEAVAQQKRRVGGAVSGALGTYLGNVTGRTIGGG